MHIRYFFGLICCTLLAAKSSAAYHFSPGSQMVYGVTITGELPQSTETITGQLYYTIKSVDTDSNQATIDFRAALRQSSKWTGQQSFNIPPLPFTSLGFFTPRVIVLNEKGRVVENNGDDQLPFVLGNAWQLPLEPSPQAGRDHWQIDQTIEIQRRMHPFPVPMVFNGELNRSAEELVEYKPTRSAADHRTFDKSYQLVTDEKSNGQPLLSETGKGQITFDATSGWLKAMTMNLQLVSSQDHVAVTIPVQVKLNLLTPDEARAALAARKAADDAAAKAFAERQKPKLLDNTAINDALAKLKSVDSFRIQQGCEDLEHAIVVKARQSEVAAALEPLLKDGDDFVRTASAKALGVWAERKNLPALESALQSGDVFLKQASIEALAHIPSRHSADLIAKQLTDMPTQMAAEKALIQMGPVAEPAVIPYLKNPEWTVRLSACKILAAIGTEKSIAPLQDQSGAEHNNLVIQFADKAVEEIRRREGK